MRDNSGEMLIFGCIGLLGIFVLAVIGGSILNGYVLSLLWGWFMVPKFGLPPISVAEGIFIALIVSYLTYHYVETETKNKDAWVAVSSLIMTVAGRPLITLLIAYIILQFLPAY